MRVVKGCAFLAVIALCGSAMAADLGSIRGALTMADGKTPVGGQAITVFDAQGQAVAKTKTDPQGKFVIAGIPTGAYKVAAAENAFAVVQVPALPKVVEVNLSLPPQVYGQGVRAGGAGAGSGMSKGVVIGVIGGLVVGGVIGGIIGYESNDDEDTKYVPVYVQSTASPSMP